MLMNLTKFDVKILCVCVGGWGRKPHSLKRLRNWGGFISTMFQKLGGREE